MHTARMKENGRFVICEIVIMLWSQFGLQRYEKKLKYASVSMKYRGSVAGRTRVYRESLSDYHHLLCGACDGGV